MRTIVEGVLVILNQDCHPGRVLVHLWNFYQMNRLVIFTVFVGMFDSSIKFAMLVCD